MSRVVRKLSPISRRKKETGIRSKNFARAISTRAGAKIRRFLGRHPAAKDFFVRVKDGKVTVAKRPIGTKRERPRVAPAGLFKNLYTPAYVAEENALAKSSVLDVTDL